MSTLLVIIATVAFMIFVTGLYVAAEFATVATRRTLISQLAGEGNLMAQSLLPIMENSQALDKYVAACQVGISISSLILGAYGQSAIANRLIDPLTLLIHDASPVLARIGIQTSADMAETAASSIAITGVLVALTVLQVILGELFPKSVAIQYPEKVALGLTLPMKWSLVVLSPFIWFFNGSGNLVLRLLGQHPNEKNAQVHSAEEIELMVTESHESGLLDDRERQLLRNAFRLRDLTARQVMVHRTRLVVAPVESTVLDVINIAIEEGFSRIPLYRETIDDIAGFVHIKDLFRLHVQNKEELQPIIREVVYVPEMMQAVDVWELLNTRRKYLAVVFDEYGGTAGLITFEDLIEEIFGEVQDEFDDEMALIAQGKDGRIYLRGDLLVSDVNEYLELGLPEETADSLSGLVISELGRPPVTGDEITINQIAFRVEAMEDLGIAELSFQRLTTETEAPLAPFSEWEVAEHE